MTALRGDRRGQPLSARELEVLETLARIGADRRGDRRRIADALFLSPHTIKAHLSNAYAKLGVGGPFAAFRVMGWLRPEDAVTAQHELVARLAAIEATVVPLLAELRRAA